MSQTGEAGKTRDSVASFASAWATRFDLGFGVGDLADEDVAGSVDAAFPEIRDSVADFRWWVNLRSENKKPAKAS